jgi:hypothetical protein
MVEDFFVLLSLSLKLPVGRNNDNRPAEIYFFQTLLWIAEYHMKSTPLFLAVPIPVFNNKYHVGL